MKCKIKHPTYIKFYYIIIITTCAFIISFFVISFFVYYFHTGTKLEQWTDLAVAGGQIKQVNSMRCL